VAIWFGRVDYVARLLRRLVILWRVWFSELGLNSI